MIFNIQEAKDSLIKKYGTVKYSVVCEHILFSKAFSLIWCIFFNFDILAHKKIIIIILLYKERII